MIRAAAIVAGGIAVAFALLVLAIGFGLNGGQWGWWSALSWVAAALVLALAAQAVRGRRGPRRRAHVVAVAAGSAVVAASVVAMAWRYSDPYAGSLVWPRLLACTAFAGFAVAALGVYALVSPRPTRAPRPARGDRSAARPG